MARAPFVRKSVDKRTCDIENGNGYSVSTKEIIATLTVPAQGSIYIQAKTGNVPITMFSRGYEVHNHSGNQGIDLGIDLYQGCTSDTNDGNLTNYSLSNNGDNSTLQFNTNPLNVVLGSYRGDLSNTIETTTKVVTQSVNLDKEYIMPLNEKDILLIQNFNTIDDIEIALTWQFLER